MSASAAVELITIGNELLLGETVDGNSAWLGRELAAAGIRVQRRATVGDDEDAIVDAVQSALRRAEVVICTGGLGPTHDDLTRSAVARLFQRDLRIDEALLESIRARFRSRGLEMAPINRVQAEVPTGAIVLPNARGTAPGLVVEDGARAVILLPGVPFEMRGLVREHVLPYLARRWPDRPHPILSRMIRTTGIAESRLAEKLGAAVDEAAPVTVAFLPDVTGVDLRLTSWGALPAEAAVAAFDACERRVRELVGRYVYATGEEDLVAGVGAALRAAGRTLAVAESCTGGLLAKRLTDPAGASDFFLGGVVAYANEVKVAQLGVLPGTLDAHGAVSEATAVEMARGARQRFGADAALAITGVAGPGGGSEEKPVGLVFIAAAVDEEIEARRYHFGGDRDEIRGRSAQAALALLWTMLTAEAVRT